MGSVIISGFDNPAFESDSLEQTDQKAPSFLTRSGSTGSLSDDGSQFSFDLAPGEDGLMGIDMKSDGGVYQVDPDAVANMMDWELKPVVSFDANVHRVDFRSRSSSVCSTDSGQSDESGVGTIGTDGSQSTQWVFQPQLITTSTRTMETQTPSLTGLRPPELPSRTQVQRHRRIGMAVGALTGAVAFGGVGACAALALGASMALTVPVMAAIVGGAALTGSLMMGLMGARIGGATQAERIFPYLNKASDVEVIAWYCTDPCDAKEAVSLMEIDASGDSDKLMRSWLVALSRTTEFLADHEAVRGKIRPFMRDAASDAGKLAKLSDWLDEGLRARRDDSWTVHERTAGLARGQIDGVEAYRLLEGFIGKAETAVVDALWAAQRAAKVAG